MMGYKYQYVRGKIFGSGNKSSTIKLQQITKIVNIIYKNINETYFIPINFTYAATIKLL